MKQALVRQETYREVEDSHAEWPDRTPHPYIPCTTLTTSACPSSIPLGSGERGCCKQIPQIQYREQQPKGIKVRHTVCSEQLFARMWANLEPSACWVSGKGINSNSDLSILRKVRPPQVFTKPEPLPEGEGGLTLKEAFWWPSQESAVTVQICHPTLCWVPLGVDPLGLSKQTDKKS